jgi:glycosyltransferase involved in cell wall biosynthesis
MYAEAASLNGHGVRIIGPSDILDVPPRFAGVNVLVIWRAAWDENIAAMVSAARCAGARIVFDVDDLMFDPSLAKLELIDGIRTQGLKEGDIAAFYGRMGQTMQASDFYTCSTQPLATAMRRFHKPTMVMPNGFDKDRFQRSRKAVEARRAECQDGRIRLGYAGGSKTHQRDFAQAVSAVARILHANPKCLLVLFRAESTTGHIPYITTEEFPELHGLDDQIEWRNIVPVHKLPDELARFDVNLAPLETGNPYCEAKSELKYFEAALVGVPTVASPTGPYAAAIRHEETGFLASSETEWYQALSRLVHEPDFRKKMAEHAFMDVVWKYGPERRAEVARLMFHQVIGSPQDAANSFALELRRKYVPTSITVETSEYDVVVEYGIRGRSEVAVMVPLYNYARFVGEALESVASQTLSDKDLIVVDDCSTDNSLIVAKEWIEQNHRNFASVVLLKNHVNSGLALTRNTGFAFADASYIMPLDADNMLDPDCLARCLEQIADTGAATVYPTIEMFGDAIGILGSDIWQPAKFAAGNYVDAMAMVRKSAWAAVGGYRRMQVMGWEDFELWCRFVENGQWGILVPGAKAHYRVHGSSMIRSVKESQDRRLQMMEEILEIHPWLDGSFLAEQWL